MRVGLQTIPWGPVIEDLPALARAVKKIGYDGIEVAQTVKTLGTPAHLKLVLDQAGVALVGLAGGSLVDRLEFAESCRPAYLYIDEWDQQPVQTAFDRGMSVGMHPHVYKTISTFAAAERYLQQFPMLSLIPDTAHLYLAGETFVDGLKRNIDRVIAVHLKDWTSRFGRSPARYARGFAALGQGELGTILEETVRFLVDAEFEGWVIVEQDSPDGGDPLKGAGVSRDWLEKHGIDS